MISPKPVAQMSDAELLAEVRAIRHKLGLESPRDVGAHAVLVKAIGVASEVLEGRFDQATRSRAMQAVAQAASDASNDCDDPEAKSTLACVARASSAAGECLLQGDAALTRQAMKLLSEALAAVPAGWKSE